MSVMKYFLTIVLLYLMLLPSPTFSQEKIVTQSAFSNVLAMHLRSIVQRDIVSYQKTISSDDNIHLILPNGLYIKGRKPHLQAIREWFAEKDWTFSYSPQHTNETSSIGTALVLVHYEDKASDGKAIRFDYYLFLVFKKQHGAWELIHDQNTIVKQ
jgi:ketosteroid isomerase-like protein